MAWACGDCGAGFGLRLSACPRCGSTEPMGRTAIVPKVTAHGGPSDQNAQPGEPGYIQPDDDGGEGEDVSPGTSSRTSSETPESSTTSGRGSGRKPARTTGNRSSQDRAESSTASGTAGSTPGTGSGRGSRQ